MPGGGFGPKRAVNDAGWGEGGGGSGGSSPTPDMDSSLLFCVSFKKICKDVQIVQTIRSVTLNCVNNDMVKTAVQQSHCSQSKAEPQNHKRDTQLAHFTTRVHHASSCVRGSGL